MLHKSVLMKLSPIIAHLTDSPDPLEAGLSVVICSEAIRTTMGEDKEEKKFDENGNPIDMEPFDVELFKYQIANGLPHTNRR